MINAEIVILGAGIVGLTLARELVARGANDILILEKEAAPGLHASGRNSGVLHAGIYYSPDSVKAQTCIKGNFLMRDYCLEKNLPILQSGKVIVARTPNELPVLDELFNRAEANGAEPRMLNQAELTEVEPNAKTVDRALCSPHTAVVDPRIVVKSILSDLMETGKVRVQFSTKFLGKNQDKSIKTTAGDIGYEKFVNAAGSFADKVAKSFGLAGDFELVPFKGLYRKLKPEKSDTVRGNIYPVPNIKNPFLGVHFTKSVAGDVYLGPTAIPAFGRENYGILKGLDSEALHFLTVDANLFFKNKKFRTIALEEPQKYMFSRFFRDAKRLVKELEPSDIASSSKVGLRPQLVNMKTMELVMDFVVQSTDESVHVLNAISPAFTGSMYFATMLADAYFQ